MDDSPKYSTSNPSEIKKGWNKSAEEVMPTGKFNIAQFNKEFERGKKESKEDQYLKNLQKMEALKSVEMKESLYKQSILKLALNTKDSWFEIMDDLLDQQFTVDTFIKNNRLFYIGMTIFVISCILYLYNQLIEQPMVVSDNIQRIYHIYPSADNQMMPNHLMPNQMMDPNKFNVNMSLP